MLSSCLSRQTLGATALTVMFQGANSLAQDLVNPEIADFAAA